MTESEKKEIKEVMDTLKTLETYLTDRIEDLYQIKGAQQGRHAYIFYRKHVWDSQYALRDLLEKATDPETI